MSVFQVLFKANKIFKDIQDNSVYLSTFEACANPADPLQYMDLDEGPDQISDFKLG